VVAFVVVESPLTMRFAFIVDEALEMKPLKRPIVVVVETPQVWTVNGKLLEEPVWSVAQPNLPAPS
jgi:hypothetical protein